MTIKIAVIEVGGDCSMCPFARYTVGAYICTKVDRGIATEYDVRSYNHRMIEILESDDPDRVIDNPLIIPSWCPLEDKK